MEKQDFKILEDILSKVNEWLKFAETKNASLIALIGGAIIAFISLSFSINIFQCQFGIYYFYNFLLFSFLGLITALLSFLPQTKLFWLWKEKDLKRRPNIFFYGDLAHTSPDSLINLIYNDEIDGQDPIKKIRRDLAEQVVSNSKITRRKYHYFRIALWFVISAILTPIVSAFLYIGFDPHWKTSVYND